LIRRAAGLLLGFSFVFLATGVTYSRDASEPEPAAEATMSANPGPPHTGGQGPTDDGSYDGLNHSNREARTGAGAGAGNDGELSQEELNEFAKLLEEIAQLQREILIKIHRYQVAKEGEKEPLLSDIKAKNKVVEAHLSDSHFQALLTHLSGRNGETDPRWNEIFGEKGQLPFVLGTQDTIRAFLHEGDEAGPANGSKPTNRAGLLPPERAQASPSPSPSPSPAASPASVAPTGQAATGNGPGTVGSNGTTGTGNGSAAAPSESASAASPVVPLVPNRYGIVPMVLTDAEIRQYMEPLIDSAVARENATHAGTGFVVNRNRQWVGTGNSATAAVANSPDFDRYEAWLAADAQLRDAVLHHAQEVYDAKARPGRATSDPVSTSGSPSK
jgi:hypothetical protein